MAKAGNNRPPDPTEDEIQATFVEWAYLNERAHPELRMIYAVPNGGQRSITTAVRLKRTGVKAGVPDICLDAARGGYHGLRLEFKRGSRGVVSPQQKWWHEELKKEGYFVAIVRSFEEAVTETIKYIGI